MANKGRNGAGRYGDTKAPKRKGVKSLPPRRTGKGKIVQANPMAHGGNC